VDKAESKYPFPTKRYSFQSKMLNLHVAKHAINQSVGNLLFS